MRFIAALSLCLLVPTYVEAKPSPLPQEFSGDRYIAQRAPLVRQKHLARHHTRWAKKNAPRARFKRSPRYRVGLTLAQGFGREVRRAFGQPVFVRGRLICAINVGRALEARGIKGTGSALARSYLNWGRSSGPVPGAVAVFSRGRGGHVAIVHSVLPNGTVLYLNPSSRRQAWVIGPYRRKPMAYRVASL